MVVSTVDFNKHGIPLAILNNYRKFDHNTIHCTFITNGSIDEDFSKEISGFGDQIYVLPDRKRKTWEYIKKLRKISKKNHFDIAHIHGNSSTMLFELLALKGTCKIICQAHTTGGIHSFINKLLYPIFITLTEFRAACNEEAGKFLFRRNSFEILNNGINSEKFAFNHKTRTELRYSYNAESKKIILHVGSFNEQKNQIFLVNLFEQILHDIPDAILWFIGCGPNLTNIKKAVKQKKLESKIIFIGSTTNVCDYMMAADCFVLPSKVESFGIVNIEAQATGLPCLISDVVPKSVQLLPNVTFISLNEGLNKWAHELKEILNSGSKINRKDANLVIKNSIYDAGNTSKHLIEYYSKILSHS